jgi:hypothetical protein
MNKSREASQVLEDFSLESVPLTQRKTWINLAVIWIGIAVVMSAIFRGILFLLRSEGIPGINFPLRLFKAFKNPWKKILTNFY